MGRRLDTEGVDIPYELPWWISWWVVEQLRKRRRT